MHYELPAAVLASLLLTSVAAHSAEPDTSKGSQLAVQWCASCHITGGSPPAMFSRGLRVFALLRAPETPTSCAPSYRIRTVRCRICH